MYLIIQKQLSSHNEYQREARNAAQASKGDLVICVHSKTLKYDQVYSKSFTEKKVEQANEI